MSRLSRALVPLDRLSFVDSDARAISVASAKIELRQSITRLSRALVQLERLCFVDSDARAKSVADT
jgi:hypothetical protein